MKSEETIEDKCLALGTILVAEVDGADRGELRGNAKHAKLLTEKIQAAYEDWVERVRAEVIKQAEAENAADVEAGLAPTSHPKPTSGAKRGPKPKKDEARHAVESATPLTSDLNS